MHEVDHNIPRADDQWWRGFLKFSLSDDDTYFTTSEVEVTYSFSSERSTKTQNDLMNVLIDPASGHKDKLDLPYHIDLAHALFLKKLPPDLKVIEIGCGGGQARSWFENMGMKYVGTDISKTRIDKHLQFYGGADILCDAHFLPFEAEVFDVVYSAAVFEHLACPIRALQEIERVLKPGGYLLSNVSFMEPWHDNSYFHMTPLGVMEILSEANLIPISVWPSRGYSGFHALSGMSLARWNPAKYLGSSLYKSNLVERIVKRLGRRILKRDEKPDILSQCQIAGAIDWIARKGH